jgi:glutamine amidotransferase
VGWSRIYSNKITHRPWEQTLLTNLRENDFFYFVHSFFVQPDDEDIILSMSMYGGHEFCSSIQKNNIFACQFHPERSCKQGFQIYKNFSELIYRQDIDQQKDLADVV